MGENSSVDFGETLVDVRRGRWSKRRRIIAWGTAAGCIVVLVIVLPVFIWGWAPVLRWTCADGKVDATEPTWIPGVLVNAPYGGYVAGNGSVPPGFISNDQGLGTANGLPASNGSVGGFFIHVLLSLSGLENATIWGAGANSRCNSAWAITAAIDFNGSQVYSGILGNQGNWSDKFEPHEYNFTPSAGNSTVLFSNGFSGQNSANISTCGESAKWDPVSSPQIAVSVPFTVGERTLVVPWTLPFSQAFNYWFPANFGTWEVDNLSAPGGPGGGWAFSYSPCP